MAIHDVAQVWRLLPSDPLAEATLRQRFGFGLPLARTLVARGIKEPEAVARFLEPSLERDWVHPELLPGLSRAADTVEKAVREKRRLLVFGDFDVDGMTATSLLVRGLAELGARVSPFIPRRFDEGYGMSERSLLRAIDAYDPELIVTVDTGIASASEVEWLSARGVSVVITDHHEPGDSVPKGVPVVDPKLASGPGSHDLAGAGVALKLLQALSLRFDKPDVWRRYLDLAALGTVSDLMPLLGENRALVAAGMELIHTHPRASLEALCAASNHDVRTVEAEDLPFCVVPRLNAAGRMGDAELSLRLLLTENPERAQILSTQIENLNNERKEVEQKLSDETMALAELTFVEGDRSIVLGGEGWHEGVKGVCATRLVTRFGVPVLLFSVQDGIAKGSGRSVGKVDLYHALECVDDLLLAYGGHEGAVGVTIEAERLAEFRQRFEAVMQKLPASEFTVSKPIDAELALSNLSLDTIRELSWLRPFGKDNPPPIFCTKGVWATDRHPVGRDGTHLRFWATDGECGIGAIRFREPSMEWALGWDGPVDVVYRPVAETWQGRTRAKLMVEDLIYPTASLGSEDARRSEPELADAKEKEFRETLTSLDEDELVQTLRKRLIGDHALLPAQKSALDALDQGESTFCVMATGRGKSLIFQLHALKEAIAREKATIIVYPLRALVSDQAHAMADVCAKLGVGVATLTGETPTQSRERVYGELASGTVDVVLTTPEYLAIHADRFALSRRVGFLVIDEAHHAGESKSGTRSAYQELPRVRSLLNDPVCLGVTATATTEVAAEAIRLIGATRVVIDGALRENLLLSDERGTKDPDAIAAEVVGTKERTIIYVGSRPGAATLTRELRHRLPSMGQCIAHYHAGLTRAERSRVEEAFREGMVSAIVATSAFGEGINLPDVRHVVLYHVPYDVTSFNQMSGRAGRDGKDALVHLIFNVKNAEINQRVLRAGAPERDDLIALWKALDAIRLQVGPRFQEVDETLAATATLYRKREFQAASVAPALGIFEELGLLSMGFSAGVPTVALTAKTPRVNLESSVRYREGIRSLESFESFKKWVFQSSAKELRDRIIKPITPDMSSLSVQEGRQL